MITEIHHGSLYLMDRCGADVIGTEAEADHACDLHGGTTSNADGSRGRREVRRAQRERGDALRVARARDEALPLFERVVQYDGMTGDIYDGRLVVKGDVLPNVALEAPNVRLLPRGP